MNICTLASGSSGNCTLVKSEGTSVLIDAGISLRRIKYALAQHGLSPDMLGGILITHEHADHIAALKMLHKYYPRVRIFAPRTVASQIILQTPELFGSLVTFEAGGSFVVDGLFVKSFLTPHDTPESVGYKIDDGEKTFALATDLGYVPQSVYDCVRGADIAVLEANHDIDMLKNGSYPYQLKMRILADRGHLSNSECGRFASALFGTGTQHIILAHLSRENNTPRLAYDTVGNALSKIGAVPGKDVDLAVAPANEPGRCYII